MHVPMNVKLLVPVGWKRVGATVITNCGESRNISAICCESKFNVPIIQFVA